MCAADLVRNGLKEKLARGEVALSLAVKLVRSAEIAPVAAACGFDALYVDMQHSTFTEAETGAVCQAALLAGITPLVRVPALRPEYVGRALDGGALGVIAPDTGSAAEVRRLVAACRFPPLGERSTPGLLVPQLRYRGFPQAEMFTALNAATMTVCMIESTRALDAVEEVAAVDGLDMLFVGTSDLASDMGITGQFDHPAIGEAYDRVLAAAHRHGRFVGVGRLASHPGLVARFVEKGVRFVSAGTDLSLLLEAGTRRVQSVRHHEVATQFDRERKPG